MAVAVAVAIVVVPAALAGQAPPQWTPSDAVAAVKALHLLRPHAKTTACRGIGQRLNGRYAGFRCRTQYPRHRYRVVFLEGTAEGGWMCAGATATTCKPLVRGFVSTGEAAFYNGLAQFVRLSAIGYAQLHGDPSPTTTSSCAQSGTLTWTCGFSSQTVTITYKPVRGGWTVAGT